MIEDIAKIIVKYQIRFPYLFILIFAGIAMALVPGLFNLIGNVEPSLEKVLPQEIDEIKSMNNMRAQFGADMIYLLVHTDDLVTDIRDPELIKYIDILTNKIQTIDHIEDVLSISTIIRQKNNDVIPDSQNAIKELMHTDYRFNTLINNDYSFTVIRIRSDTGASAKVIKDVIGNIEQDIETTEEFNPGSTIQITGFNAIDKATFEVIMSDFAYITLISMILVGIVVFITFKSFIKGMLPMIVVMNALLMTMGITGYLGLTITVISMVAAAMIMGLGIDFGIHVVHSYFEQRNKNPPKKALLEVMTELLRAMIGASLTTIAGFLALLFGVLPAMKTLGIILSLGIFNTLLGAVFLLPVIVYLYDIKINPLTD